MRKACWFFGLIMMAILVLWVALGRLCENKKSSEKTVTKKVQPDATVSEIVAIADYTDPFLDIANTDLSRKEMISEINEMDAKLIKEKGLVYTDSFSGRYLRKGQPSKQQYPRLQINLFMETGEGGATPMSTLGYGTFEWMTDTYSFREYGRRPFVDGFTNSVSYDRFANMWDWAPEVRQKWMDDHGLVILQGRAWGVTTISVPILPVNFTKRFPEFEENEEAIKRFRVFLRAGEWYKFFVHGAPTSLPVKTVKTDSRWPKDMTSYIRTPDAEDLELGKVIVMNHVFRKNEQPPLNFTNRYSKEKIAKGLHLKERFKEVNVKVRSEIFDAYPKLTAMYHHNIPSRGFLNSDRLSKADSSCAYRVSQVRPGGILLATTEGLPVIRMVLRNIRKGQTKVVFPDDADYVLKNPVRCSIAISADLRETLGTAFDSYLHIGIDDGSPVAMGKPEGGGQSVEFKVNEGEFYIRFLKTPELICPGKVVICKGHPEVTIKPLSVAEKAKWEEHWNLLKSRHPLAQK